MQRINSANKAVDLFGPGKHGFQPGVPSTNTPATFLTPEWCNAIQEEIARVIEHFSITLDTGNPGQLLAVLLDKFVQTSANDGEIGKISYVPATAANQNHLPVFGAEVSRTTYSKLWTYAQASGALVDEATFPSRPGCFSYGPGGVGGSTFRVPKIPGLVVKAFHNNDSTYTTNTTAAIGQYLLDEVKAHTHQAWTWVGTGDGERDADYQAGRSEYLRDTTSTGGAENTVRSVVLFPQIRYR